MPWHESWTAMQELNGRDWMLWREFYAAVQVAAGEIGDWKIRQALAASGMRPQKKHGFYRYTQSHVRAVRAYAEQMGWIREDEHGMADD